MKKTFQYKKESKQNPYIGFTSFQHFRNDELYSDLVVLPENNMTETEHVECYPIPDYVKENGRAEGYYPDCSVVYIRILWKEFEPKQGEFNYAFIEDILNKARENGQTLMFRLMPHSTRESDDVPDWVKEQIECPARPEGAREKISPKDPKFLTLFGGAIKAFGERFDDDPTLAFVDVALPGAWGEGSSCHLFTEEQLKAFADIYTDSYQNTLLIGQVGEPWLVRYMNEKAPVGWRADCIGKPELLQEYVPSKQVEMPDVWKKGHISFEAYWWCGEWKRKGWDLDEIIQRVLGWHASTFNAKSLPIPFEWQEKIDEWIAKMGYHFVIEEVEFPENAKAGETCKISFTVNNVGVAPIYHYLPLVLRLEKGNDGSEYVLPVDIRTWQVGKNTCETEIRIPKDAPKGNYTIALGMGGKDKDGKEYPTAVFATDTKQSGDFSVVGEIKIDE